MMRATVRSLSDTALDRAIERVGAIVENTARAYECRSEILWEDRVPAVWNSPQMMRRSSIWHPSWSADSPEDGQSGLVDTIEK
jgi:metal-dependent amidase/aminoacylase/carboxypeptidase family protein